MWAQSRTTHISLLFCRVFHLEVDWLENHYHHHHHYHHNHNQHFLLLLLSSKKRFWVFKVEFLIHSLEKQESQLLFGNVISFMWWNPGKKVSIKIHFKKYSWQKLKSKAGSQKNYKDILPLISCCLYITSCSQHSVWTDRHTLLENGKKKTFLLLAQH